MVNIKYNAKLKWKIPIFVCSVTMSMLKSFEIPPVVFGGLTSEVQSPLIKISQIKGKASFTHFYTN